MRWCKLFTWLVLTLSDNWSVSKTSRHLSVVSNFDVKILMRSEVVNLSKSRRMGLWTMDVYVGGGSAARRCLSVGFLPYKISLRFFLAASVRCWRMRSRVGWHSRLRSAWPAFEWMYGGSADGSVYGFLPFGFGPYRVIWEFPRWFALNKSICSCEGKGEFDGRWGKLFDTTNTQIYRQDDSSLVRNVKRALTR